MRLVRLDDIVDLQSSVISEVRLKMNHAEKWGFSSAQLATLLVSLLLSNTVTRVAITHTRRVSWL